MRTLTAGCIIASLVFAGVPANAQTRPAVVHQGASYARAHGYTVGIAVVDTKTGQFYGAGHYNDIFASESIVKVFIATRLLMRGEMVGSTKRRAYKMITQSDDSIATSLYRRVGGDSLINWVKKRFHVPALGYRPSSPDWWGNTHIRPAGLARLYAKLKNNRRVGPWLLHAMHHATKYGSDGTYQFFGLPSATTHAAIKQGWGNDLDYGGSNADFNTTGFVNHDRYAVAILARGPASSYGHEIGALLTQVARRVLPNGHFPDPPPHVASLSRTAGRTAGGTTLTLHGSNLTHVTAVRFGSRRATNVQRLSPHRLRVVIPAHGAGVVHVRVSTNHGTTAGRRFHYIAAPTVTKVPTPSGTPAGGNAVTVWGSGFYSGSAVSFDMTKATHVRVISHRKLQVIAPAHDPGVVDITVATRYGRSTVSPADRYTYTPAPPKAHQHRHARR